MWVRQAFSGQLCSELQALRRAFCKREALPSLAGRMGPWRRTQHKGPNRGGVVQEDGRYSGAEESTCWRLCSWIAPCWVSSRLQRPVGPVLTSNVFIHSGIFWVPTVRQPYGAQ